MVMKRKPTHPGEVLKRDVIEPLGLTVTDAARRLGVTRKTLSALLNGRSGISAAMAIRVARATGATPESWLQMQAKYDLWMAAQSKLEVEPFVMAANE